MTVWDKLDALAMRAAAAIIQSELRKRGVELDAPRPKKKRAAPRTSKKSAPAAPDVVLRGRIVVDDD